MTKIYPGALELTPCPITKAQDIEQSYYIKVAVKAQPNVANLFSERPVAPKYYGSLSLVCPTELDAKFISEYLPRDKGDVIRIVDNIIVIVIEAVTITHTEKRIQEVRGLVLEAIDKYREARRAVRIPDLNYEELVWG